MSSSHHHHSTGLHQTHCKMDSPPYHSRTMATVMAIPELLENILLQVDMGTLLTSALRVNKDWNALITSSPVLQEALFFSPISEASEPETWDWDSQTVRTRRHTGVPSSRHSTASSSTAPSGSGGEGVRGGDKQHSQPRLRPVFNPLLRRKFDSCFFDFGSTYGFFRRTESFHTLPWTIHRHQTVPFQSGGHYHPLYKLVKPGRGKFGQARRAYMDRDRFTREGASWRRMLVSQPPPRASPGSDSGSLGYLWWRPDGLYGGPEKLSSGRVGVTRDSDGSVQEMLTMGQLYDLVQYHAGHHDMRSLWFRVTWGSPKPPYVTMIHQQAREKLAASSSSVDGAVPTTAAVVVEFLEFDDDAWFSRRELQSTEGFDSAFRCEEASPPVIESPMITALPLESTFPAEYDVEILQAFVVSSM